LIILDYCSSDYSALLMRSSVGYRTEDSRIFSKEGDSPYNKDIKLVQGVHWWPTKISSGYLVWEL